MRRLLPLLALLCVPSAACEPAAADPRRTDRNAATNPIELPRLGMGLGGIAYYANGYVFADALRMETRGWRYVDNDAPVPPGHLNAEGYVTTGRPHYAQPFQNNAIPAPLGPHPVGRYTVTWDGDGEVILPEHRSAGFVGDRRTEYDVREPRRTGLRINVLPRPGGEPVTDIRVWLPDPADPSRSLAPEPGESGPLYHPMYVDHLREDGIGVIRFMDWLATNNNAQRTWADRRPPGHAFSHGHNTGRDLVIPGTADQRGLTGIAWEHVAPLANELKRDAWVCLPHAVDDGYVRNVARVLRFGSDADGEPYTQPTDNPHHPPLSPDLRLWVEHSNEIWSNGGSFRQGDWASQESERLGVPKPAFNGKRAAEVMAIFDEVYAPHHDADKLVRVAAAFTAVPWYTETYVDAFRAAGAEPDVLAVTTYFAQPLVGRVLNDLPWLEADPSDPDDPVVAAAVDLLIQDLLAGGRDMGERGNAAGGFGSANRELAAKLGLPIVAYEGGPSIYTEGGALFVVKGDTPQDIRAVDKNAPGAERLYSIANHVRDHFPDDDDRKWNEDRFTKLIMAVNRHEGFYEAYRANLGLGLDHGLRTHLAFVDFGRWGKHGQWGHKEYVGQPSEDAVKWRAVMDWQRETADLTPTDGLLRLDAITLPAGRPVDTVRPVADGLTLTRVAGTLHEGLTLDVTDGVSIRGTATRVGTRRVLLRATDDEGNADWAMLTVEVVG